MQDVQISVTPPFLNLMPLSASRIRVIFLVIQPVKSMNNV
jgi:hypothetical protein